MPQTNVTDLVEEALAGYDRPDIQQLLLSKVQGELRKLHGLNIYRGDVVYVDVKDPSIVDGSVSLLEDSIFGGVRKILQLQTFASYNDTVTPTLGITPLSKDYKDANENAHITYAGFQYSKTYKSLNGYVSVTGLEPNATLLRFLVCKWPSFYKHPSSSEFYTDSWIAAEFPEVVKECLTLHISRIIDKASITNLNLRMQTSTYKTFVHSVQDKVYVHEST